MFCANSTVYDYGFYPGPYSDVVAEKNYKHLLLRCDYECWSIGTRWSIVFAMLGFANLLIGVQGALLAIGVWVFPTRFIGLMCQTFLCLYFATAILSSAVFRFNDIG